MTVVDAKVLFFRSLIDLVNPKYRTKKEEDLQVATRYLKNIPGKKTITAPTNTNEAGQSFSKNTTLASDAVPKMETNCMLSAHDFHLVLKEKLSKKLEHLRSQRNTKKGITKTRTKSKDDKKPKKKATLVSTSKSDVQETAEKGPSSPKVLFNKISEKKPAKKSKSAKVLLDKIQASKKKLNDLEQRDPNLAHEKKQTLTKRLLENKILGKNMDSVASLTKELKNKEKKKLKSTSEWKTRIDSQKKSIKMRIKKRADNIAKRAEKSESTSKKPNRTHKKPLFKKRPGFEGSGSIKAKRK